MEEEAIRELLRELIHDMAELIRLDCLSDNHEHFGHYSSLILEAGLTLRNRFSLRNAGLVGRDLVPPLLLFFFANIFILEHVPELRDFGQSVLAIRVSEGTVASPPLMVLFQVHTVSYLLSDQALLNQAAYPAHF